MSDDRTRVIIRAMGYAALLVVAFLLARARTIALPVEVQIGPIETASVIVAGSDLAPGTRIGARVVRTTEWPAADLPAGAFTSFEALEGRVLRHAVPAGEPILESSLLPRVPVQIVAV